MIKLGHNPNFEGGNLGKYWKLGKVLEKCQNYSFSDIFWDILNKMKDNLGQESVKGGFYPSRAELEQFPLISLEK